MKDTLWTCTDFFNQNTVYTPRVIYASVSAYPDWHLFYSSTATQGYKHISGKIGHVHFQIISQIILDIVAG